MELECFRVYRPIMGERSVSAVERDAFVREERLFHQV